MLLKESRLSVLVVKGLAPPSSLELDWCKGIWKGKGGSKSIVQLSCVSCSTTRMVLALPPKHSLLFSCRGKQREEIGFLSAEFSLELLGMLRKSVRAPLQRTHSCSSVLAPVLCPMSQHRPFSHPLHMAMSLQCAKKGMKNWRDHDCKQLFTSRAKLLSYKASLSRSATLTALERLRRAG